MKSHQQVVPIILIAFIFISVKAQKKGLESISTHDLKMHMAFLASDELEGRNTGEFGLKIAARYLAVQARQLGLQPAGQTHDFFQPFTILEKAYDRENSQTTIKTTDSDPVISNDPFYIFPSVKGEKTAIEGEVVFAGYGINDENHGYNDFEGIDIKDKIVLIMNRAPMNEEGTETQFDTDKWTGMSSFQYKMPYIYSQQPKAVMLVFDPKSGFQSIEDMNPEIADYLEKSRSLKIEEPESPLIENSPKTVFINRSLADQLLEGSGRTLKELQLAIDRSLAPHSFLIADRTLKIELHIKKSNLEVSNVFGLIEGSDPVLKEEVVIYLAHFDHLGTDGKGGVFNGADDNASGTTALLEIAEAFMKEKKRPKRSVGFLWVSAEEIGLFGSQYFAENPLVIPGKIAAVINIDMVGRTKTVEDETSGRRDMTIVGGDTVKVIGGMQSVVLMDINKQTLKEMGMYGNYTYNDPDHPERYFYRSDHISFARKDIPVLFYSTGTHRDYHLLTDVEERIDYNKFLKMTRFCFKAGFNVAHYKDPIEVDNPYSTW